MEMFSVIRVDSTSSRIVGQVLETIPRPSRLSQRVRKPRFRPPQSVRKPWVVTQSIDDPATGRLSEQRFFDNLAADAMRRARLLRCGSSPRRVPRNPHGPVHAHRRRQAIQPHHQSLLRPLGGQGETQDGGPHRLHEKTAHHLQRHDPRRKIMETNTSIHLILKTVATSPTLCGGRSSCSYDADHVIAKGQEGQQSAHESQAELRFEVGIETTKVVARDSQHEN